MHAELAEQRRSPRAIPELFEYVARFTRPRFELVPEEQIFDEDRLRAELDHADLVRRRAASLVAAIADELASRRAGVHDLAFDDARRSVFDLVQLRRELEDDGDDELHDLAERLIDEVAALVVLRASADGVPDADVDAATDTLSYALAELDDLRDEASRPPEDSFDSVDDD
jgi:hypothetical protein